MLMCNGAFPFKLLILIRDEILVNETRELGEDKLFVVLPCADFNVVGVLVSIVDEKPNVHAIVLDAPVDELRMRDDERFFVSPTVFSENFVFCTHVSFSWVKMMVKSQP